MGALSLSTAQKVVDAAIAKAHEIGHPMNIAVVDDGGHLVTFVRMDGAIKASIDISIRKARTSDESADQRADHGVPAGR
ncbi:hypothetical protein OKHIL_37290 [Mycolicibacterium mageritense]